MMSCDFWVNTHSLEVIDEYWDFVKNIYQQNPVYFNRVFSIQNLVDLMVKISDIKYGHCCEFHQETFDLFYQGIPPPSNTAKEWVMLETLGEATDMAIVRRPSIG
jgi:hypothetical protein